jgi:AcrR family transcriptional regulator
MYNSCVIAVKSRKVEQGEATRRRLLGVAKKLFSSAGYAATSIEQVAREAGVTKGALYHHFRDKPALFEAVLGEMVRGFGKQAQRESGLRSAREGSARHGMSRVEGAIHAFLDQLCAPETNRILLVDGPAVLGREHFDRVWVENSLLPVRRVLGPLDDGPGLPEPMVEPVARLLLGAVQEAALAIARSADPVTARRELGDGLLWVLRAIRERAAREGER